MAVFGSKPCGSGVIYNLGAPLQFEHKGNSAVLNANVKGQTFKAGESYSYQWLTLSRPSYDNYRTDDPKSYLESFSSSLQRYEDIRNYLGMGESNKPGYSLNLRKGRVLSTRGLLDLKADREVVDLSIPAPTGTQLHVILGLRVYGLNSNWSALIYDRAKKRSRPVGTYLNVGYVRLNTELGEGEDVVIGHPIVASNMDLVITFTQLQENPAKYYCLVHNPTRALIKSRIMQRMDLSGLNLGTQEVEVPAGGDLVLLGN